MSIEPDGKIESEEFIPSLFNQSEYRDLSEIFDQNKQVECLIKDDKGNVNCIEKTNGFTVPEFKEIHDILYEEAQKIILTKPQAKQIVCETFRESTYLPEILHELDVISDDKWSKNSLLNCFKNKNKKNICF